MDGISRNVDFLKSKFGKIFVVFSITNSLTEDIDVFFQTDWKSVLTIHEGLLQAIVCICDQKSFNSLVVTF